MASILTKKKGEYTLKDITSLGRDLLSPRTHTDNLPLLISFISPESEPSVVVKSLDYLRSYFTPLISELHSTSSHSSSTKCPGSEDGDDSSKTWLRSNFDEFVKLLLDVLVSEQFEDTLRETVLGTLMEIVILHPAMLKLLRDFLTKSYDVGGVVSVMALSTLFILMTKYGLEYPNFYDQLSALLVPSVFVGKHRARFLQLLDNCLKSSLLPAYMAASLTKKLSRLSLSVPPSDSLVIMALIYNLLQRHPSINHLAGTDENANEAIEHNDSQPEKSDPMKSFFWEMDTLRHHYYPPVSRFVSSLETELTIRSKTTEKKIEDFSSGSYATIFGEEMERISLQVPLAFYETVPTSLFEESDFPGWTFTIPQEDSKC
ncbi:unnamed protein product [Arabis nemorensis]|uniref:CCAAT-binding factor domain-containing protein n=1 Tax=Arabis nemorensis TaxID=586526 RepID=A0A565AWP0_9BRAS|nr:unnamed protein product [Arabis nemorensis]